MSFLHLIPEFVISINDILKNEEFKIKSEKYIDNVCYRVSSYSEYKKKHRFLLNVATLINESILNDRNVSVFKLFQPINIYRSGMLSTIVLSMPKSDSCYAKGLVHAEFIVGREVDLAELMQNNQHLSWDFDSFKKNLYLSIKLYLKWEPLLYVKFRHMPLERIIEMYN
jgi:predicted metalloenzyme YecM